MKKPTKELEVTDELSSEEMQMFSDDAVKVYDRLFYYIQKIVHNSDVAEDILHDTLLTARRTYRKLLDKSKFEHWISKIAKYKSLDELKRQKRFDLIDDYSFFDTQQQDLYNNTENIAMCRESTESLKNIIAHLPADYRKVLYYYYYHNYSLKQISEIYNMNYNTVVSLHSRALKIISKYIPNDALKECLDFRFGSEVF